MEAYGEVATDEDLRLLRSEVYHATMRLVYDTPAVKEAIREGVKVLCGDNILRRVYLIWAWGAHDYPEK